MPKSRGRTHKARKNQQQQKARPEPQRGWWTPFRKFWVVFGAGAVILGAAASAVAFLPRVAVEVSSDAGDDPWSSPFIITNTNIVPLEDLGIYMGLCRVVEKGPRGPFTWKGEEDQCGTSNLSRLYHEIWLHHRLAMDEKYSVTLQDAFPLPKESFGQADISIVVSFDPWIIPVRQQKEFRFVTRKTSDGKYRWFPQTIDNP
jgi:hypothetical protein